MPQREVADNFVMLKSLTSQLMVLLNEKKTPLVAHAGSYVWIIWSHWREAFVPEEIRRDFLGKKRCLNILKPWTDLSNLLFHWNQCQMWLIFHQTELSLGNFIFSRSTPKNHLMFLSLLRWWNLSQKKNICIDFISLETISYGWGSYLETCS